MVELLALAAQHGHLWQALGYVLVCEVEVSNFDLSTGPRMFGELADSVAIPWRYSENPINSLKDVV